jgi:iron complex transport system ATP-binding protein
LKIACGFLWPNAGGKIFRNGTALQDLRKLRESTGWVTSSLAEQIPHNEPVIHTVISGKFAQFGLCEYKGRKIYKADYNRAENYLHQMNCAHLAEHKFGTLSQGEMQRVLISRARMAAPLILILDEPCAGLDPGGRELLLRSIQTIGENHKQTALVYVTHHIEEIMPIFEYTLAISAGRSIQSEPTKKVISSELIKNLYGINAAVTYKNSRYNLVCR